MPKTCARRREIMRGQLMPYFNKAKFLSIEFWHVRKEILLIEVTRRFAYLFVHFVINIKRMSMALSPVAY